MTTIDTNYYIEIKKEIIGPISLIELLEYEIRPNTLILKNDGISDWTQAKNVDILNEIFQEKEAINDDSIKADNIIGDIDSKFDSNENRSNLCFLKDSQTNKIIGPLKFENISDFEINEKTEIWTEGLQGWVNAYDFVDLSNFHNNEVPQTAQNSNKYFIKENSTKTIGPLTIDQIQERGINKNTMVWTPGMKKWMQAEDFISNTNEPPELTNTKDNNFKILGVLIFIIVLIATSFLFYNNSNHPQQNKSDKSSSEIQSQYDNHTNSNTELIKDTTYNY